MNTLYKKYKETLLYLIFGVLTVIVNISAYELLTRMISNIYVGNSIAFIIAVLFAYLTNTGIVFGNQYTIKNFVQFMGFRLSNILIDNIGLYFLVNIGVHDLIAKVIVNLVIIVMNYIVSKYYIFKRGE